MCFKTKTILFVLFVGLFMVFKPADSFAAECQPGSSEVCPDLGRCSNGDICAAGHKYCVYEEDGNHHWGDCARDGGDSCNQCPGPQPVTGSSGPCGDRGGIKETYDLMCWTETKTIYKWHTCNNGDEISENTGQPCDPDEPTLNGNSSVACKGRGWVKSISDQVCLPETGTKVYTVYCNDGTSYISDTRQSCSYQDTNCRVYDGNQLSCNTAACKYFTCNNTCWPGQTSEATVCPSASGDGKKPEGSTPGGNTPAACQATYSLSPAGPEKPNTPVTVTFPALKSSNVACVALFQDGKQQSCSLDQSAPNGLKCTVNSGSPGTHALQLKYGQSSLYPSGTNCGSPVECNSTTYVTRSNASAPTPLPAPADIAHVCADNGQSVILKWVTAAGATGYKVRINQAPFEDWVGAGDEVTTVTNASYSRTVLPNIQYNWSVQAQPAEGPWDSRAEGGNFTCTAATAEYTIKYQVAYDDLPADWSTIPEQDYTDNLKVKHTFSPTSGDKFIFVKFKTNKGREEVRQLKVVLNAISIRH